MFTTQRGSLRGRKLRRWLERAGLAHGWLRTIRAAGGKEYVPLVLYVRRRSPRGQHFRSQRVRQVYDEFARPVRLRVSLAILPLALMLLFRRRWRSLLVGLATIFSVAEAGRRRGKGQRVFPFTASLLSPVWVV